MPDRGWLSTFWKGLGGIHRHANSHGLKKLFAIKLDGLGFHLEPFSRFVNRQQRTVIGDVRNDFNFLFPEGIGIHPEKLRRRNNQPRNRHGDSRKSAGTYQRE